MTILKNFETCFDFKGNEICIAGEINVYSDGDWDLYSWKVTNQLDIDPNIEDSEIDNEVLKLDFSELAMETLSNYKRSEQEREEEAKWLRADYEYQEWKDRKFEL
jgi:hypothetical protein